MPTTIPPTLEPEPTERLTVDAENVSRTDAHTVWPDAWALHEAALQSIPASPAADDLVIALQVRGRLARADSDWYWTSLEDVIRENGFDPADFGLE